MAGSSIEASRRTCEIATAIAVAIFGIVVAADSLTHDIRWDANGPAPGYFPFRVGLLIVAVGVALTVRAARSTSAVVFATREEGGRSWSVFWPTALLALAMFPLGCYVPAAVYLAWMMHAYGAYRWARAVPGAILVVAGLFVLFEFWLQVPLAKGPIEAVFGIY